jgi:hypothetical protein
MREVFILIAHLLVTLVRLARRRGLGAVAAESLAVKHQLLIMKRAQRRAPKLTSWDRLALGVCALFLSPKRLSKMAVILKASTLMSFHHALVKRKYHLLYSPRKLRRPGPKGPSKELIDAVIEMKRRNPRFGCRKIAEQISSAFGIEINKDVVRRILIQHSRPVPSDDGPSWLTVIGHAKDSPWSVDFFRCESMLLKSYWIMVVMDVFTAVSSALASHRQISTVRSSAGCSIARSRGRHRRNTFLQITIHCFAFIGGVRIFVYWKLMRSTPFPVHLFPILSLSD